MDVRLELVSDTVPSLQELFCKRKKMKYDKVLEIINLVLIRYILYVYVK